MRLAHEANFLEPGFPVGGRAWPALAFCAASSGHFRRHRSLRANRHKLAETPRLCHGCAWRTHSGGQRMPGYPAFLALIYALTGRTGESARWWVMLAQIPVDLLGCLVIARLAGMLTCPSGNDARGERAYTLALWLAAVCPFTANYTAVPLT